MKHLCQSKAKADKLKTPQGILAYDFYSKWMKCKGHTIPPIETFSNSRYFNALMRFAEYSKTVAIPNPGMFVQKMVEHEIDPILWCKSQTCSMYLVWYDKTYPPEQQFIESMDFLKRLALGADLSVISELFGFLGAEQIASYLRNRKLSPWLLAASKKFLDWFNDLPIFQKTMISDAINLFDFAAKNDDLYPGLLNDFRIICEEEQL